MRRSVMSVAAASLTVGLLFGVGQGVSMSSASVRRDADPRKFEAVAGVVGTRAAAAGLQSRLSARGFSGFVIEPGRTGFEVERSFTTLAAAQAEVNRLRRAGFRAFVESEMVAAAPAAPLPARPRVTG